jgi:starch-binding outer membrane protein, SusD/RagB family
MEAPEKAGHLNHPDQARPNGVAAKAYKGRALLYAASPLNNDKGQAAWEDAAKANWEAIQVAEQNQFALLSGSRLQKELRWSNLYTTNSFGHGTPETLDGTRVICRYF